MVNEKLILRGEEPVAFDHDCREGICGACSMVIDGVPHGPEKATTTCQLHMRHFQDGDVITIDGARDNWFGPWPPPHMTDESGKPLAEERRPK